MKDVYITAAAMIVASLPKPGDSHGQADLQKIAITVHQLALELELNFSPADKETRD